MLCKNCAGTVRPKDGPHEFSISLASLDSISYVRRILTVWSKRVGFPGPDGYFGVFGGFFGFSSRVYVHHQAMPSREAPIEALRPSRTTWLERRLPKENIQREITFGQIVVDKSPTLIDQVLGVLRQRLLGLGCSQPVSQPQMLRGVVRVLCSESPHPRLPKNAR